MWMKMVRLQKSLERFLRGPIVFLTMSAFLIMMMTNKLDFKSNLQDNMRLSPKILLENETVDRLCGESHILLSNSLPDRVAWKQDEQCSSYHIRHMIQGCREPIALASYPGSGNTWLRYLIEGASGIFTGSIYDDIEIEMKGMLGELRNWKDGTTLVQKTHEASLQSINEFNGKGILLLRNPYSAILSYHSFMHFGHFVRAPSADFQRKDWESYVTIMATRWLNMTKNWILKSTTEKLLIVHYENLRSDVRSELQRIMKFLKVPIFEKRLDCLLKFKDGEFHRRGETQDVTLAYKKDLRKDMDVFIERMSQILEKRGHGPLPVEKYEYYRKSDKEVLKNIRTMNEERLKETKGKDGFVDMTEQSKLVLQGYDQFLQEFGSTKDDEKRPDYLQTMIMKNAVQLFKTSMDERTKKFAAKLAEGLLPKAMDIWSKMQRMTKSNPIDSEIEANRKRIPKTMKELLKTL